MTMLLHVQAENWEHTNPSEQEYKKLPLPMISMKRGKRFLDLKLM